jgi:hypothetical protein
MILNNSELLQIDQSIRQLIAISGLIFRGYSPLIVSIYQMENLPKMGVCLKKLRKPSGRFKVNWFSTHRINQTT